MKFIVFFLVMTLVQATAFNAYAIEWKNHMDVTHGLLDLDYENFQKDIPKEKTKVRYTISISTTSFS